MPPLGREGKKEGANEDAKKTKKSEKEAERIGKKREEVSICGKPAEPSAFLVLREREHTRPRQGRCWKIA